MRTYVRPHTDRARAARATGLFWLSKLPLPGDARLSLRFPPIGKATISLRTPGKVAKAPLRKVDRPKKQQAIICIVSLTGDARPRFEEQV